MNPQEKMSSHSTKPATTDKRIETLFVRLGAIYGHIWLSSYKNERVLELTKKEWSEGLQRFDTSTLRAALLRFREQAGFPPTLPQFIECCKAIHKRNEPFVHAQQSAQPASLDVAERHIKAMLDLLKR
jgi:hypothetical protein